jgi:prevent-host-death family protein
MTSVGSYEAKTHLPQLLERVENGERIMITKRGKPVAMVVPPPPRGRKDVRQTIEAMRELRKGNRLGAAPAPASRIPGHGETPLEW